MNRTILQLDRLESREVPAAARPTLDLTRVGAEGSINGALFSQYNARANPQNGPVDSFLRLDDGGREKGYNTDARPLQFDESRRGTSSIRVDELPLVTIRGVNYRQIVLDVNEPSRRNPKISLDELQIFVSNNPSLRNYNEGKNTLGGLRPVWEMGGNRWVSLDASLNNQNGTGDMIVAIPDSLLQGGNYLALFSKFGVHQKADGASEQWGPGFAKQTPPQVPQVPQVPPQSGTTIISGIAYIDDNGNRAFDAGEEAKGYSVVLRINDTETTIPVNADGSFSFSVDLTGGATYELFIYSDSAGGSYSGSINGGETLSGIQLKLIPAGG